MYNGVYKVYSVPIMLIAFQTHTEYNKKLNKVAHIFCEQWKEYIHHIQWDIS